MTDKELRRLAGVLAPLQQKRMPLAAPPPRDSRFGAGRRSCRARL
jgi:bifunctional non-homologous end joining protein LigD